MLAAAALPPRLIAYAADLFPLYVGAFAFEESIGGADPAQFAAYLRSLPPEDFPVITGLADDLVAGDADERFEVRVEVLIADVEALAQRRGRRPGRVGAVTSSDSSVYDHTSTSSRPVTEAVADRRRAA